jgi:hypothetical protein
MDKSEIRIIVDVKKTITLLSSKPTTLGNIASEFGSPLKRNTYEHGIKPFNNDLDRIEITEIEAVSLVVKEDSPIFIEALQESFGEYTRSVAYPYTPSSITFKTKPSKDDQMISIIMRLGFYMLVHTAVQVWKNRKLY